LHHQCWRVKAQWEGGALHQSHPTETKNPKATTKKVSVLIENPEWILWSTFPYKMLQKRYQAFLINYLKEQIQKDIDSDHPDPDLKVFSEPAVMTVFLTTSGRSIKTVFSSTSLKNEKISS
jgi:hypothetical protein